MEILGSSSGLELVVRMVFGFAAAVAGITLWAHSREPAWILVITAVLLSYAEVIMKFIDVLGIYSMDSVIWAGIPWVRVAFAAGVPLLFTLGLFLGIRSFRKP